MHRTVGLVFKILAMSILLMLILDTVMILVQVVSVHSRIENISGLIQTEVARNNCLPESTAAAFTEYIENIAGENRLMQNQFQSNGASDIKTNFTEDFDSRRGHHANLKPENAKNYGEITEVAIEIKLHPLYVIMGSTASSVGRRAATTIVMDYIYKVPCLRYLK